MQSSQKSATKYNAFLETKPLDEKVDTIYIWIPVSLLSMKSWNALLSLRNYVMQP